MNRPLYLKMLLCCVIVITLCQPGYTQVKTSQKEAIIPQDVGRDNPFEKIKRERKKALLRRQLKREISPKYEGELFVQTIMLKFLDARNLKIALENMLSEYGVIAVDSKSNSLIISDMEKNLEKIINEIKEADRTPQQLMIEVVILDVQLDDDTEIGINWDVLTDRRQNASYRQKLGSRLNSTRETAATIGNATAFNTTAGTASEGGYFAVLTGTIRTAVHLLQEKKDVEILASPRLLVVSGESAFIETIEEIPYRERTEVGTGGVLATTEFRQVGVKLSVTATLTDDNYILVTVEPEQSVNTGRFGTTTEIPIIDIRRAKTTLLLKDGEVVVMGGLRKKEITNQVNQIPFFGDLPLIGFLFRNTQTSVKNSELIVFLSPHIYLDDELTEEEMARFNELRDRPLLEIPEKQ